MLWQDFAVKYAEQVLPGLAEKTQRMFRTVCNALDRTVKPVRLGDFNESRLAEFAAQLRAEGLAETASNLTSPIYSHRSLGQRR